MDFGEVIRRRRMVRRYDAERPLPEGLLDHLVDVARRAPSAGFTQGVSFVVLETTTDRDQFWQATTDPDVPADRWLTGIRAAPGLILVTASAEAYLDRYAQPDKGWTERSEEPWTAPYWFVDAGMASMAILYAVVDAAAEHAGLGACFFGVPADRVGQVRSALGIPSEQFLVGVISVGHRSAEEKPSGSVRRRARRPRAELVHHGRWRKESLS